MAYKCYSSKPWLGGHQTSFNFPTYNSRIAHGPEHREKIFSTRILDPCDLQFKTGNIDSSSSRMLILIIQMFWGCLRERWNKFEIGSTPAGLC